MQRVSSKRVLVLGTYPIAQPQHGGQKRTRAILDGYARVFAEVKYVAVFSPKDYPASGRNDIAFNPPINQDHPEDSLVSDLALGRALASDPGVRGKFVKLLTKYHPDIIQVEQPYVYSGLAEVLTELGMEPAIVYSSQNVESHMKEQMLTAAGCDQATVIRYSNEIQELEQELVRSADLVIAVSKEDVAQFSSYGPRQIVLASNGIAHSVVSSSSLKYWSQHLKKRKINKMAIFVGSAHLPNWEGFLEIIGPKLGFLPFGTEIMIVGGVGGMVNSHQFSPWFSRVAFLQRAEVVGRVDEASLAALLSLAEVIILPITTGGGSNLKTAEAILSGKKIVATPFAFRGHEQFQHLSGIDIESTPEGFRTALVAALLSSPLKRSSQDEKTAGQVVWSETLRPLTMEVKKL